MAGIPPFIGFFSKQFVLYSALDSGYYFISLLGIIVSVISASYYLKIIKILHVKAELNNGLNISDFKSELKIETITNNFNLNSFSYYTTEKINLPLLSQFHSLIISILSLFILFFILKPTLILNSTQVLSLTLFKL